MDVFDLVRSLGQYGAQIVREPAKLQPRLRTCLPWSTAANGLCLALNRRYLEMALENSNISGVIVPNALVPQALGGDCFVISADLPELLFCEIHNRAIHALNVAPVSAPPPHCRNGFGAPHGGAGTECGNRRKGCHRPLCCRW